MTALVCRVAGIWETLRMPLFWRSLVQPPLVVVSGHVWDYPPRWGEPVPSAYPEDWPGLVQYDLSRCVRCDHAESPPAWRRYYGLAVTSSSPWDPGSSSYSSWTFVVSEGQE